MHTVMIYTRIRSDFLSENYAWNLCSLHFYAQITHFFMVLGFLEIVRNFTILYDSFKLFNLFNEQWTILL